MDAAIKHYVAIVALYELLDLPSITSFFGEEICLELDYCSSILLEEGGAYHLSLVLKIIEIWKHKIHYIQVKTYLSPYLHKTTDNALRLKKIFQYLFNFYSQCPVLIRSLQESTNSTSFHLNKSLLYF